jgi:hypothetical protein
LGTYDLDHLRALHRNLFGQVYDWAGQLRTIDISKGPSTFAHHGLLEIAGGNVLRDLAEKKNHLGASIAPTSSEKPAGSSATSTPSTPSGRATAGPSAASCSCWANDAAWQLAWRDVTPPENIAVSIASATEPDALIPLVERITQRLDPGRSPGALILPPRPASATGGTATTGRPRTTPSPPQR